MIEVLLVDDESYVMESLLHTIPWSGIGIQKVHTAASAADALEILNEHQVDIVVTDIRMPKMSGLELIQIISEKWEHMKCILLTGHADFEYAKKAIQLHAFDFLLKPVDDDEFMAVLSNAVEALKDEWEQSGLLRDLTVARKADLTALRHSLLHDLLLGRHLIGSALSGKLSRYELPFEARDACAMLLLKMGKGFSHYDHASIALMEYAVGNIAEEVFGPSFELWHGKGPHEYLVILLKMKLPAQDAPGGGAALERQRAQRLTECAYALKRHVGNFLKGDISLVITDWFTFPEQLARAYRTGLSGFFGLETMDEGSVLALSDRQGAALSVKPLDSLYKPPTLIHLFESNQWDAAEAKLHAIFGELRNLKLTNEHLYEVFFTLSNSFVYIAHKHGQFLADIDEAVTDAMLGRQLIYSLDRLEEWTFLALHRLKDAILQDDQHTKSFIIKQVQEMVAEQLDQNVAVRTIAEQVYLHPVYLSKVYKAETGESLGDYIIRKRMEKAAFLLKGTNLKIYEITARIGYQNPQYFSKIFKKLFGLTPQEYRDQ